jgi:hypothetical protein
MRIAWLAPGLALATTVACGGVDRPGNSTSAPACAHGPNLVQTTSSVIVSPADVGMVQGMSALIELSPPVATKDGRTVLATWTAVDASGVTQGHAVVAHLGTSGVAGTSAPVDAPAGGVAAFDGTNFLVSGRVAGGPPLPTAPTAIQLQRVALDGNAVGGPQTIETVQGPGLVTSAVWTPQGLAVAWWASNPFTTAVQLFGDDGHLIRGLVLDPTVDEPGTSLKGFAPAAVALFDGQLVVANGHAVSTLDWLGGPAQTSQTGFVVSVPEKGGFPTLFDTGGQLRIWGSGGEPFDAGGLDPDAGPIDGVYAGAPGGAFTQVGAVDFFAVTQASDGCGGAVTLSNRSASLGVVSDTAPERLVSLGTTVTNVAYPVAAMAATPSGFAVVWVADDGMHLATLAWQ